MSGPDLVAVVEEPLATPAVRPRFPGSSESPIAAQVQQALERGEAEKARELYAGIVARQQRRATRIAYHYLRDAAEADDAVQEAFVKAYLHLASFKQDLSFEVWLTRILINACLDRRKMRARRERWLVPALDASAADQARVTHSPAGVQSPEEALLAKERRDQVQRAVDELPDRQRTVFILTHFGDHSTREVAAATGLSEATVRVHLFRAVHKLRKMLEGLR
jgi:RNA polymerase sigma-70 factor (ECF subfamily)